jgi:hypothetical protein
MLVISALRRQRQEDGEFRASLATQQNGLQWRFRILTYML